MFAVVFPIAPLYQYQLYMQSVADLCTIGDYLNPLHQIHLEIQTSKAISFQASGEKSS